jgi:DNA end-binding protein Ku
MTQAAAQNIPTTTTKPSTSARSIGTATISLGLVAVPIKLYTTAESSNDIHFNMLHDADGARLKQQYVCTKCNEVVDREHTHKGYEHAKGQYVTFTADELAALDAVATHSISLEEFVPAAAIDPLYIEKSYYLGPDKGAERAYRLIRDAMVETGLVGVASYSARGKQHIVSLRPFQEGLILHQLRYAEEVKDWCAVPLPVLPEPKPAEIDLAKQIILGIASETFSPGRYRDEVQERMLALIENKIAGQEITVAPNAPAGKVIDLMEALKASLGPNAPKAPPKMDAAPVAVKSAKRIPPKRTRGARAAAMAKKKTKRKAS